LISGNVTTVKEWDYYAGAPPSQPNRQTLVTYLTDPSYLNKNILDHPSSVTVIDGLSNWASRTVNEYDNYTEGITGSGAVQHDPSYSTGNTLRGNLTATQEWRNTDGVYLTTRHQYDDACNPTQKTEPNGNSTYISYVDSWGNGTCAPSGGNAATYPSSVTNALSHVTSSKYNSCTGTLASTTDPNNQTTTYTYNDSVGRLTEVDYPDGGQTIYGYVDTPSFNAPYVYRQDKIDATHQTTSWTQIDGLGRVIRTAKLNGEASPNIVDDVDTCYDSLGRKIYQTYSYQMQGWQPGTYHCPPDSSTPVGDSFTYDALGRVTQVAHADNSTVSTDYSQFPSVTVTDETGRLRRDQTDALGRLTMVWEPDGSGNLSYETDYQYDTLDNLIHVDQKGNDPNPANWRTRTFSYDSLSRLLTASNPESGTIQYAYDNNGNLQFKTSPVPNQTSPAQTITYQFGYDALNRLIWKWHPNSSDPVERYFYDQNSAWGYTVHNPIGRLVVTDSDGGTNGQVATLHSYDAMGRIEFEVAYANRSNTTHKQFNYAYNLDGSLKSITYPSGRLINYSYNAAQRPISAVDSNNISFATAAHYTGSGGLGYVVNGATSSFGGLVATENYNLRMQPNEIHVAVGAQPPLLDLIYDHYSCGGNNGNVCAITNSKDSARSQAFAYDYLNRLIWAWTPNLNSGGAHNWGESFAYDPWGNLLQKNTMGSDNPPDTSLNITVNTRNQATNWCYDAAGNIIDPTRPCPNPPLSNYPNVYDGENRLTSAKIAANTTSYDYDADGQRVKKSGSTNTLYWYGPSGQVLEETDLNGNLQNEYIFFGAKRVARYNPANGYSYYFSDHLGTADVVTDASGVVKEESDYYPFGGERIVTDSGIGNNYKFTGKERDPETGCDYFGARYYCNPIGRFITPDPENAGSSETDPQSWNAYAYARNNPLLYTDPSGKTYVICQLGFQETPTNCIEVTDNEFAEIQKDPTNRFVFTGSGSGDIYDGETKIGTFDHLDEDLGPLGQGVFSQPILQRSADVTEKYVEVPMAIFLSVADPLAAGSAGVPEVTTLGIGRFVAGQVIRRTIQTASGKYVVEMEVESISGETIVVKHLNIGPEGGGVGSPGTADLKAGIDGIEKEISEDGFSRIVLTNTLRGGRYTRLIRGKIITLK